MTRTAIDGATAQITVAGRASAPEVLIESSPQLPQDEILARVLFGKRVGSLSAFEPIQPARSAFQLTGIATGPDVIGGLREGLGLDRLGSPRAEQGQESASLNAGRRIAAGIDLGLETGLEAGSGRARFELDLLPNVSVET